MSNALDETLLKHGADKGELRFSLKQDLYQLILTEVIGEDEPKPIDGLSSHARQILKEQQRQTLEKLFNQEATNE